ncbi:MAG TPA: LPXTG cell wall anchor domain-containing protein [Rubrobacter sp.]|nr:LPXTG cell wall anchor domain-containing protein [Rubrobacter sp.]
MMRRILMVVLMVAIGALVLAPAAFAQDDNPSGDDMRGDDRGGERAFDDNPSADDLREDDRDDVRGFDDNPTGDDGSASATSSATASASSSATPSASPSASATASATPSASPVADDSVLPETGGVTPLALVAGILLLGSGIGAVMLMRRRTS